MSTPARLPGPKPLPLVGNLFDVLGTSATTTIEFMEDYHRKYGGIFALSFPGQRQIVASSQALVSEMCASPLWSKSVHTSLEHIRDFAGDGLFTAYNEEPNWGIAHRLLMPAFGTVAMKDYFSEMLDVADQMLTRWARFGPGHRIDVTDDMTRLTLDTIALCAFDVRFNSFYSDEPHPFVGAMGRSLVEAGARGDRLPGVQPLLVGTNRRYRDDIAAMRRITEEIVAARVAKPGEVRPRDLLERMLTAADPVTGERLSAENIQYQLATFLIAGHETTSGLLSFATHALLRHPDVLRRARESVDEVLGDRTPEFADLAKLGYLGQVLRETLRLHPTAPAFALSPSEATTLGGYAIEAGEDVLIMLPTLHRDPAVWPEPETFDPDRFAPERMNRIPEYAWMPFGHGARACIGRPFALQEATFVLAMMLQRFDIELADPDYELVIQETLTIKPKHLGIRVTPRRKSPQVSPARTQTDVVEPVDTGHGTPMLVLYGSNGGSSESLARTIAGDGEARGWATAVVPLDDHVDALPTTGPVVIVSSSYNGTPPDNAGKFVDWLTTAGPDLSGVDYFVLGCGSLDWAATYQRIPTVIDEAMAAAGARRLRERGAVDARTDFFGDWDRWYEPLWPMLSEKYGVDDVAETEPRFRVVEAVDGGDRHELATAVVLENRELVRAPGEGSKRHLEVRLPSGFSYRTGDYLSVLPQNHPSLVARMIQRLGVGAEQIVTVESTAPAGLVPIGRAMRIDDLLTRYVDLSGPATPRVAARLGQSTTCPPERTELQRLADAGYATDLLARRLTLLDLMEMFGSCEVDLALALELLPAPRVRQYSISSAAEKQEAVALTVSVLEGSALSGNGTYVGAASGYLRRIQPGDRLTVAVTSPPDTFRPPADNATPVVMIAAGSGIAPFRGFVQARVARAEAGEELGPTVLFFGCRHPDWDDLYAKELAEHVAASRLEIHRAYSRQPQGGVRYVQDRLSEERTRVRALIDAGAHVYVCGDSSGMAPAVEEAVQRISGGCLADLRAAGRYATDVF
ncbi:bifunctional cytochrome P450/NADPH--P450 reductase [Amycolatopsis sp. NPDC098790]|uniref:bifunctional cytochrome P450/NADPH--P450 reductase n=1 Tax=Amycolatopsis sp. NPDC098790 TaxID=3363939 RepID=UPI00380D8D3A